MATIQEFQSNINKFRALKEKLRRIASNIRSSAESGKQLSTIIDSNLSINGLSTPQAANAKDTSVFMDSIENYITNSIIPYIDYEINNANTSINQLREEQNKA